MLFFASSSFADSASILEGVWNGKDAKELAPNPAIRAKLCELEPPNNDDIEKLTRTIKDSIKRLLVKKG